MFALIDCNSFFCSVEKAFHPGLTGKPVCVLSNNDGCIVALTPEAKRLGLHRGDPIFRVQDTVNRHQVHVFSTNMQLYAAMSRRIWNIVRKAIAHVEVYSIDECFCRLDGYGPRYDPAELMRDVAHRIRLYTDVPVSVGIAPTKTLAKMGSKFAKQYAGYRSVCAIDTDEKRRVALSAFPLSDVWGIGRSTLERLSCLGVDTPLDLANRSEAWARRHLDLPTRRTWLELNGSPCIDTAEALRRQTICTSRSFGHMVTDIDQLREAVAKFTANCARELRGQGSVAGELTVVINSNPFRDDLTQYRGTRSLRLAVPTADTLELTRAALALLADIYRPGIAYKRAGVVLSDITPDQPIQLDLFDPIANRPARRRLMQTVDRINQRFGPGSLRLSVEAPDHRDWHVKCQHRSPNYLTDVNELLTVN